MGVNSGLAKFGKTLKLPAKLLIAFLFLATLVQVSILTVRFGSGHWVTVCSAGQGNDENIMYGSVYFTNKDSCSKAESPKITVWAKDPLSFNLDFLSKAFKNKNAPSIAPEVKPTTVPTPIFSPTPNPIPQPGYSASVLNRAIWGENGITISAQIKNFSVKPYITNFAFNECAFTDNSNNKYNGSLEGTEIHFDKAILPSASMSTVLKVSGLGLDNGARTNFGSSTLTYQYRNTNGETVTKTIAGLKIVSCKAYITTDDSQASNGWGKMPITVKFP